MTYMEYIHSRGVLILVREQLDFKLLSSKVASVIHRVLE